MLADLIFSFGTEIRNGEVFLSIQIQKKNPLESLPSNLFVQLEKEAKDLAVFLQKAKNKEIFPSTYKIYVPAHQSVECLRKLASAKKLMWNSRSVFFNPLSTVKVQLEAEEVGEQALVLSGSVEVDKTSYSLDAFDFLFHSEDVTWAICKQILFVFPEEMDLSWLGFFHPEPRILEGKEKDRFIYRYKEDPAEGFPKIRWKGSFVEKKEKLEEVYPCLELKDRVGMFAVLWMEYGDKKVAFTDPRRFTGRDLETEKGWERDLLETGFQRKPTVEAEYYCPTDQIAKSLSFLLEIGWKIIDVTGRRVVKMTEKDLSLSMQKETLLVQGSFSFAEHKVDLDKVVGAFERKERFLDLSDSAVGWLDEPDITSGLQDLVNAERVIEGRALPKNYFGCLEDFRFSHIDEKASSLLRPNLESVEDEHFQGKLWPYQEEGKRWLSSLYSQGFSALLADEMGLGKTVQTLSFISKMPIGKPILIIAPTSLLFNWKKEWEQFIPHKSLYVHQGRNRQDLPFLQKQQAIVTSYAYLRIDHTLFRSLSFSCIVLDEAQWIKNPESQLARAAFSLQADMKICLTGTPIENSIEDLWSLFHFLDPKLLGDREDFRAKTSSSVWDSRYQKNLQKRIRPFILRRKKEEVLQDLPEKIEQTVFIQMEEEQRSFYEEWLIKTRQGVLRKVALEGVSSHRMEVLEAILRLRQICTDPRLVQSDVSIESAKIERVLTDLEEIVSQKRKVLVYSQFTTVLKILEKKIQELGYCYVYLDGQTQDRQGVVSAFQNDPSISIFLISLKAGGVGLNLTAADYVFLLDPWWNEAVEKQAMDRAHRLGRKEKVFVRRYIAAESIEEKMMKLKAHKIELSEGLLDRAGEALSTEQMIELLLTDG